MFAVLPTTTHGMGFKLRDGLYCYFISYHFHILQSIVVRNIDILAIRLHIVY
jgi:hypothetical protein